MRFEFFIIIINIIIAIIIIIIINWSQSFQINSKRRRAESFFKACCQWGRGYLMCKSLPYYFHLLYISAFYPPVSKVHAGSFVSTFRNPLNSDMGYRIFNVRTWSSLRVCTQWHGGWAHRQNDEWHALY